MNSLIEKFAQREKELDKVYVCANEIIDKIQEELMDAILYIEKLKMHTTQSGGCPDCGFAKCPKLVDWLEHNPGFTFRDHTEQEKAERQKRQLKSKDLV